MLDATALVALALPVLVAVSRSVAVPKLLWSGAFGYGLLLLAPALDPKRRVKWDRKPLPAARLGLAVVCAVGAIVQMRSEVAVDSEHIDGLIWVLVLGVLANAMPALQPNWFLGVRTPWTLRDDEVWRRTHRVAGHLLLATSAFLAGLWWLTEPRVFASVSITAILAVLSGSGGYSWWLWRQRPRP